MTTDRRQIIHQAYRLAGGPDGAIALDDDEIETRVEEEWYTPSIARATLRALMQRSDLAGLRISGLGLSCSWAASSVIAFFAWGSWWATPRLLRLRHALYLERCPLA